MLAATADGSRNALTVFDNHVARLEKALNDNVTSFGVLGGTILKSLEAVSLRVSELAATRYDRVTHEHE